MFNQNAGAEAPAFLDICAALLITDLQVSR